MKTFSIKVLKEKLGELTEMAANGEPLNITKYNKPYILIIPSQSESLNIGSDLESPLRPVARAASRGVFLDILDEDRYGKI